MATQILKDKNVQLSSAGVYAQNNAPTMPQAVEVLKNQNIAWDGRSSLLDPSTPVDEYVCMTEKHVTVLKSMLPPSATCSVRMLIPGTSIGDPYNLSVAVYEKTRKQIHAGLLDYAKTL